MSTPTVKQIAWQLAQHIAALAITITLCYFAPTVYAVSAIMDKWNGRTLDAIYDVAVLAVLLLSRKGIMDEYEELRQESIKMEDSFVSDK